MVLIVFEGLDRSGKTTQCRQLIEYLRSKGKTVHSLRYPDRKCPLTGKIINDFLLGEVEMTPHTSSLVFAANLWDMQETLRKAKASADEFYVMDRYIWSCVVYSVARGMDRNTFERLLHSLPTPDITFYMDVSIERMMERGGYGEERFEKPEFQRAVSQGMQLYLNSSDEWGNVIVINASPSVEQVEFSIQASINPYL